MTKGTLARKEKLLERVAKHRLTDIEVTFLPYLDFDETQFATPYETGCRMLILFTIAYSAPDEDSKKEMAEWLKRENLWEHVSEHEKMFFEGHITDEEEISDFEWFLEHAYILAWALDLIKEAPSPTAQINEEEFYHFVTSIPDLGEKLDDFLPNLRYRDLAEIYDENLFYELTTTYFRDLMFLEKEDTTDVDVDICFFRHKTLNWLRRFMGISDWDETNTST